MIGLPAGSSVELWRGGRKGGPAERLIGFAHYHSARGKPQFPPTSPHLSATSFPSPLISFLILPTFFISLLFIPLPQLSPSPQNL